MIAVTSDPKFIVNIDCTIYICGTHVHEKTNLFIVVNELWGVRQNHKNKAFLSLARDTQIYRIWRSVTKFHQNRFCQNLTLMEWLTQTDDIEIQSREFVIQKQIKHQNIVLPVFLREQSHLEFYAVCSQYESGVL